jgi:hypothetical protein
MAAIRRCARVRYEQGIGMYSLDTRAAAGLSPSIPECPHIAVPGLHFEKHRRTRINPPYLSHQRPSTLAYCASLQGN